MHLDILPLTEDSKVFYGNHNYNLEGDCGFDLGVQKDTKVYFKSTTLVKLDVSIVARDGEGLALDYFVVPRSSISKLPYRLANSIGTIDKNYRGTLIVALDYHDLVTEVAPPQHVDIETGKVYSIISKGTRLVQIVAPIFRGVLGTRLVDSHDVTNRAEGAFGSTGA